MRKLVLVAMVGALVGGAVLFAPPALAATCSGSSVSGTGAVMVASGQTCSLSNQTVNSSITVNSGGTLHLSNVLVTGGVSASNPADIDVSSSVVKGAFQISGSGNRTSTYDVCGNLIGGTSTLTSITSTLHFGVASTCAGNRVCGSLNTSNNPGVVSIDHNSVVGSGMLSNNAHLTFTNNAFGGSITAANNPGATVAGNSAHNAAAASTPCQRTTTLTTNPGPGGAVGVVVLNDTATLSGGAFATGSIKFKLFAPSDPTCTGTPAYQETVPVSGNGAYSTHNTTPASVVGTWHWTAKYSGDANNTSSASKCRQEPVVVTGSIVQGSCQGSGSISTLVSGSNVTSYIPKGSWSGGSTGIDVVNVEGSSITNTLIPTADVINSCASNSVTGKTVCTANNTQVYVISGTAVSNVLTDAGSGTVSFTGGSPTTVGVSMDPTNNKALIGLAVSSDVGGFQFLDLATNTFEPAFATQNSSGDISEDPLIDPVHHYIGSASEDGRFELINVATTTAPTFFEHTVGALELDSTAEDCSTGILLAPAEFTNQVEIADISNPGTAPEAVFTPGSPGSWTAPEQVQTLTNASLSAGASGSSVAQGTHIGVIAGEFGGDTLTAVALPTTSGAGATPAISNWVTCAAGHGFSNGLDPHTLIAYASPANGHAIALMVNAAATQMVAVDLTQMLDNTVIPATGHVCDSTTLPAGAETFITLP